MIYGDLVKREQEKEYKLFANNTTIVFGNQVLEEDVKLRKNNNTKDKFMIRVRTQYDGGRSNNPILHGVAVKVYLGGNDIDLFIKGGKDNYSIEFDRHLKADDKKAALRDKNYKLTKKFILKNAELLSDIYKTREFSDEYNKLVEELKEKNPEFKYIEGKE